MRCIPQQQNPPVKMPGRAFDRHHRARGIGKKVISQIRHKRNRIRKPRLKKLDHCSRRDQLGKTVRTFERQKENAGKCPVNVGQGNEHVVAPRPDVKGLGFEDTLAISSGWNHQFLVPVVEILL